MENTNNSNNFFSTKDISLYFNNEPISRCVSFNTSFSIESYKGTLSFITYDPDTFIFDQFLGKTGTLKAVANLNNGLTYTIFYETVTFDSKISLSISADNDFVHTHLGFTIKA